MGKAEQSAAEANAKAIEAQVQKTLLHRMAQMRAEDLGNQLGIAVPPDLLYALTNVMQY